MMRRAAACLAAVALVLVPARADATPASGVTGTILAQWTAGGTDFVLRRITVEPGGSTGWHFHDGTLFGHVETGTLTRSGSDCTTIGIHPAGTSLVEPSGSDHVHIGRNLGATRLVLDVLYVNPAGAPLARDAADPGCSLS